MTNDNDKDQDNDKTGVRLLPPLIFLAALVSGSLLHKLVPIVKPFPPATQVFGGILMLIAVILALASVILFRKHRTDIDPRGTATTLLQTGPYNFSRNPIYLAMVLFCAGLAIVLNSLWIIIALVPAILTVHFHVITREEQHLARQFGQDFTDYRNRVRRWI